MLVMLFLQVTEALRVVLQARLLTRVMCLVWGGRPPRKRSFACRQSACLPRAVCLPHHQDSWLLVLLPGLGGSASRT